MHEIFIKLGLSAIIVLLACGVIESNVSRRNLLNKLSGYLAVISLIVIFSSAIGWLWTAF